MASHKRKYEGENKRQKFEYQCDECKGWFMQKDVQVDHIEPVGELKCWEDLPGFCERLFVGIDKLQLLCGSCHTAKTATEREARKNESLRTTSVG